MAGETIKTKGIVLEIRPWSQTSHVTVWLTPDHGPVSTLVKGAVRPKSAFLGQYDLFYTCELIYYARAKGELHAIREVTPVDMRDGLRGDFRATALASYAAYLVQEHCPHGGEAYEWFSFLDRTIDGVSGGRAAEPEMLAMEMGFLSLAGLSPDFSGADLSLGSIPFAIDLGHAGMGAKTVQLPMAAADILANWRDAAVVRSASPEDVAAALRFLGLFMRYHIDMAPEIRRNTLQLLAKMDPK